MGSYNPCTLENSNTQTIESRAEALEWGSDARSRAVACLVFCSAVLLVGILCTASAESATLFGLEGPACLLRGLLGEAACPSCGLTRSTAMSLQGRLADGFALHAAGPLVALLATMGVLGSARVLLLGKGERLLASYLRYAGPLLLLVVLITWGARLIASH